LIDWILKRCWLSALGSGGRAWIERTARGKTCGEQSPPHAEAPVVRMARWYANNLLAIVLVAHPVF
jgi:hypothetical protein